MAERAASITARDPGWLGYLRAVGVCALTGAGVGILIVVVLLLAVSGKSGDHLSPGIWILIAISVCAVGGLLVGLGDFRPYRYTLEGDYLSRVRYASHMTPVRQITSIDSANWTIKGVRIKSPSLKCTLTVRDQTLPLLLALGESLTRLNFANNVLDAEARLALGLGQNIPERSQPDRIRVRPSFESFRLRQTGTDALPGAGPSGPQDRPADRPTGPTGQPALQDKPGTDP